MTETDNTARSATRFPVVELVELHTGPAPDSHVMTDLRVDGQSFHMPIGGSVDVHAAHDELTTVTVTFIAGEVHVIKRAA